MKKIPKPRLLNTYGNSMFPHTFALSGNANRKPCRGTLVDFPNCASLVCFPGKKEFKQLSPETISQYVKPFIMRRKKSEVLQELPDLIEMTYKNELADDQKNDLFSPVEANARPHSKLF